MITEASKVPSRMIAFQIWGTMAQTFLAFLERWRLEAPRNFKKKGLGFRLLIGISENWERTLFLMKTSSEIWISNQREPKYSSLRGSLQ